MYCSLIGCFNMNLKTTPKSAVKIFFLDPRKLGIYIQKLFFRHARLEWNDGKWRMSSVLRSCCAFWLLVHRPIKNGQNMLDVCVLWFIWPRNVSLSFTLLLYSNFRNWLISQLLLQLVMPSYSHSLTGMRWKQWLTVKVRVHGGLSPSPSPRSDLSPLQ